MENKTLDIVNLIDNNPLINLNRTYQSKFITKIKEKFTEPQQQIFAASFYAYLNYNKTDFVIVLNDIWKWMGFSRKEECKRVLVKHFKQDIDYKIFTKELGEAKAAPQVSGTGSSHKNLGGAGKNKEKILVNVNTFKKLSLKSNTKKADEIHDYYIKLEETYQETMSEESHELRMQLEQKDQLLIEQKKQLKNLENKPDMCGFSNSIGYNYLIADTSKPGHYKTGCATNTQDRLSGLNCGSSTKSLEILVHFKSNNKEFSEKLIHNALRQFRLNHQRLNEWFYLKDDFELAYAIKIMKECIDFANKYNLNDYNDFKESNKDLDINKELNEIKKYKKMKEDCEIISKEKQIIINKNIVQNLEAKTGEYKGVSWCIEKAKWKSELKCDYKNNFLGYFDTELDGAKAYNNYALYLNQTKKTNYSLNDIPDYTTIPIDIPVENNNIVNEKNTSKYIGVSYNASRKYYQSSIKLNTKSYHLGNDSSEIEVAKLYNQQALYFNNTLDTKYILNEIENYVTIGRNIYKDIQDNKLLNKSSKYFGVSLNKLNNKYKAGLVFNKKQIHIGQFTNEIDAVKAYNSKAKELNEQFKKKYKLNEI